MFETVYIVGSAPDERRRIAEALADVLVAVKSYDDAAEFLDDVAKDVSGCVLVPADLPGMGLQALMEQIGLRHLPLAIVVIGRDSEFALAVDLVRAGAFDFLEHPFSDRRLRSVVRNAIGSE